MAEYNNKRLVAAQLSIQPNVPNHMIAGSHHRAAPGINNVHIINQKFPQFPTKKFRMRSLLWVKHPQGEAMSSSSSTIAQLIPTIIVNIASLSAGISLGFSAIALPQLHFNNNETSTSDLYQPFYVSEEQGSWIASIFGLGAIFGGFMSGFMGNNIGRRKCLLLLAIPDLIGWIHIVTSQNLLMMLLGRFLCGFAAAGYTPSILVYISEMAQPQHRGWLTGLTMPIMAFGSLIAYGIGAATSWHNVSIIGGICSLALIPCLSLITDSPYWYMQKGEDRKAIQALMKFRSSDSNAFSELLAISDSFKSDKKEPEWKEGLQLFASRQYRRPFVILNCLFLLVLFSGNFAISFYAVDIFRKASREIDEYISTIVLGIIKFVGAILFIPAIRFCTRKMLMCASSFAMGVSLAILGLTMYSHENGGPMEDSLHHAYWLPLLCVTIYMISYSIGLGSIPFLYSAEFYPAEMRSILSGMTISLTNLELFLVVKTFPNLNHTIGESGTFWLYSGVCFAAIIFTLLFIPETKGKELHEIEDHFSRKKQYHSTPFPTPLSTPFPSPSVVKKSET